jgi:hypothetical protein
MRGGRLHDDEPSDRARVQRDIDALVARVFFAIAAATCASSLGVVLTTAASSHREIFSGGVFAAFAYAGLLAASALLARRGKLSHGVTLALAGTMACATLFAILSRLGIHALVLGVYGTLIVVAAAVVGMHIAGRSRPGRRWRCSPCMPPKGTVTCSDASRWRRCRHRRAS